MFKTLLTACVLPLLVSSQPSWSELRPLIDGLTQGPPILRTLEKRVPLMTDDPTVAPLVSLQVFAPPVVPGDGKACQVELLSHVFGDGSYNVPAIVPYVPPSSKSCGEVGQWAAVTLNLSVYSIGTQYDRLGSIYLSHVEIWRTSSAEPTKTGTIWTTIKDVTHYMPLFAKAGDLMMDFSNIIAPDLLLDGEFHVTLTATFYAPTSRFPAPATSDLILPLSNLSPSLANYFSISDDIGGTSNVSLPSDTVEAYVEIFCSGNSAEEFWYLNTPDEFVQYFPASTGIIGKGPFREVRVLIDGQLAGVVFPYPVIYTGGITPSNWRPLTSYGAYDAPTYWIDVTPFLPVLLQKDRVHSITLSVFGQGTNPTINSNWFVSGSIHARRGSTDTTGTIQNYTAPDLRLHTEGKVSRGNETVWTKVTAHRELEIETILHTSEGTKVVKFSQKLDYNNEATYVDEGWIQWGNQSSFGTVTSSSNGQLVLRDAFSYPVSVFSNYSLYTEEFGGYGSEIQQSYVRALQLPILASHSVYSVQHAKGEIGMDNWPGLRHAINGTGATTQNFGYIKGDNQTYFRKISSKNDGWVRDDVWGSLKDGNPALPDSQISGPDGGPGFRRSVRPRMGL